MKEVISIFERTIGTFWSDRLVIAIQCSAALFLASLEVNNSNTKNCHSSLIFTHFQFVQTHSKFEITSELQNFDHFNQFFQYQSQWFFV